MSTPAIKVPEDTLHRQRRASDPRRSAWVSANAGSGKTHVLTRRVLRLLLDGVPPARVLCLTFTKVAAANMAIQVSRALASWARLDDAALAGAIAATGAPAPRSADLPQARTLFARTVETPGGLKIQTIHAFCERVLQLFPFEANVPARFEVLDDARATDLLLRAREAALAHAMADADGPLGRAVSALAGETSEQGFSTLVAEALGHRALVRAATRDERSPERLAEKLGAALGLRPGETAESIARDMVAGPPHHDTWGDIARRLGADGGGPGKTGNRLALAALADDAARIECYLDVFLTSKREPRADAYLSPALRKSEPALCEELDSERARLAGLVGRRRAALVAARSAALLAVTGAVLDRYDGLKRRRGLLDFDDLIGRTRALLEGAGSAWVLYKLDRGIDHVLVDEAQDTSREQWDILEAVSGEFFAGAGRSAATRTFFAVGDEKQSIYSFQGARPALFADMRARFERRARDGDAGFEGVELMLSFRSARAILHAVDQVFAHPANARGLTRDAGDLRPHRHLRSMPGLVEIWPVVAATTLADPSDWRLPVDVVEPGSPALIVARRVAAAIARLVEPGSGETVADGNEGARRPVRAGDVLVLVRSRNAFFEAVIRALKERGVPVAGADRLVLTEHIAVMDLVAAGRAALSPGDDYALACLLKSPLIGLDDDDLIALAPGRKGTLIGALEASPAPAHRRAAERIARWRAGAAHLTPFAFYARLLGADRGRRDLLGRLGPEAADAIDEFVALTLAHERDGAPSLLAFLARLEGSGISIKRDMEAAGEAVRVMTVHAAKGLEAKIVFLPDTCGAPDGRHDPKLFRLGGADAADEADAVLAWSPRAEADPARVTEARENARGRALEEHNRLLYVAMTRAEERLYVAGFRGAKGVAEGCWYGMIEAAGLDLTPVPAPWDAAETVGRFADPAPPAGGPAGAGPSVIPAAPVLPDWIARPAPAEPRGDAPPVRPSNPLGAADGFAPVAWTFVDRRRGRDGLAAGRLMHKLLQHLPDLDAGNRRAAAARFLAARARHLAAAQQAAMVDRALAVLGRTDLAPLFGTDSRAEVAVTGRVALPSGRTVEVTGVIDRVAVTDAAVFIADYKTGTAKPEASRRHALQIALYRAAVAPLYPDRAVRAFLVWTSVPDVVELAPDVLDAALRNLE